MKKLKFTKSSPCKHFRVYYTLTTAEGYKIQQFKTFHKRESAISFVTDLHNSGQEVVGMTELSFVDYLFTEVKENAGK